MRRTQDRRFFFVKVKEVAFRSLKVSKGFLLSKDFDSQGIAFPIPKQAMLQCLCLVSSLMESDSTMVGYDKVKSDESTLFHLYSTNFHVFHAPEILRKTHGLRGRLRPGQDSSGSAHLLGPERAVFRYGTGRVCTAETTSQRTPRLNVKDLVL